MARPRARPRVFTRHRAPPALDFRSGTRPTLRAAGSPRTVRSLLNHLRERDIAFWKADWFARQPRGRVLDIPAGKGDDSRRLVALGYDVVPADLFPETFDTK